MTMPALMNNRNNDATSPQVKIAHLLPGLGIGGCERIVLNLHLTFAPAILDSTILFWDKEADLLGEPAYNKLRPFKLELAKPFSIASVIAIYKYLKHSKTELLHTHLTDADLLGFFAAKLLGIPHVVTIHSYPFPALKTHCLRYKFMTMFGTRIICVSEVVRKHVVKKTCARSDRISTIYSGIDLRQYPADLPGPENRRLREEYGIKDFSFVIGCISRIVVDKGHEFLLRAVPLVLAKCKNACFLIVGDGHLREALKNQARQLGIENSVIFAGMRTEIPKTLSLIDLFVYPSLHESLGLSVIEAMAAAKPIIVANSTVIPELITHEKNGIIVPLADPEALAGAIIDLYGNPEKRAALGRAASCKAQSFSLDQTARSLEQLYSSLIFKKKVQAAS